MRKSGILNHELLDAIAMLGHTDLLVVADAGLPVPPGVRRIDLAVVGGVPRFMQVLQAVLGELQIERAVIAQEMHVQSPDLHKELIAALGQTPVDEVSHEDLKQMTQHARAVVRTGEFTPYANVVLVSGVVF
jgi:D-ribose pyranase